MGIIEDFHMEMLQIYERAKEECNYCPTRFLQIVNEKGGLDAAKFFLHNEKPQEGLYHLWELNCLDLSMEALVIKKKYRGLFSDDEIKEAHRRLEELEYKNINGDGSE